MSWVRASFEASRGLVSVLIRKELKMPKSFAIGRVGRLCNPCREER